MPADDTGGLTARWRTNVGCRDSGGVLAQEPFRTFIPSIARLVEDRFDSGTGLSEHGDRGVRRRFDPVAAATVEDVVRDLVSAGQRNGWVFSQVNARQAVGVKHINGSTWMVSVYVRDDQVVKLLAGR